GDIRGEWRQLRGAANDGRRDPVLGTTTEGDSLSRGLQAARPVAQAEACGSGLTGVRVDQT
ncbi:MAG: hypothetical protein AAB385_04245, partial [Planctomycetota bacterium]